MEIQNIKYFNRNRFSIKIKSINLIFLAEQFEYSNRLEDHKPQNTSYLNQYNYHIFFDVFLFIKEGKYTPIKSGDYHKAHQ